MCSEKKTTMAASVPEELVEDIFLKLPVKSIVRFKTASKKWYSFLSQLSQDHNFAKNHLKQSESENLIFYQNYSGVTTFKYSNVDDTNSSHTFNFPVEIPCELIGSANGLICLAPRYKGVCFIWNPCTGESKTISVSVPTAAYRLFGFGYDSYSDDYKIVGDWGKQSRVFSLRTNSWRMVQYSFEMFSRSSKAVHLNGVLHWCIGREIAAFDLAKEEFNYIEMPENPIESIILGSVPLFDYQGSLCASGEKSVWVMKEYGDSKSWAKLGTFVAKEHSKPVGISRLGEVVFCTYTYRIGCSRVGLVKSDIHGRISDDELKIICHFKRAFAFRESLISPKCFDCLHPPLPKKMIKRPRKQRKTY